MTRFGSLVERVDHRQAGIDLPLMSVSQTRGVIRRSELTDRPQRAESLDTYKICRKNDIVFNKMSIRSGAMGVAPEDGLVTYHYEVMRPRPETSPQYIAYLMKSAWFTAELIKRERGIGAGDQVSVRTTEVPFSVLKYIDCYFPPLDEQRAIADYLDRETARIDTLSEEQGRLIETLRERRQAEITHSTEAGARAAIPLVRCMTKQVDYRGATPTKTDSGTQLITARNVKPGWIDYEVSQEFVDPDEYEQIMRRGLPQVDDILLTMEAPLGNVALVDREDIALAQRVIKWSVDRRQADPRYLLYAILGDELQFQLYTRATGSTAAGIKASKLPELRIWLPPLDEQRHIAAYLDGQTAKIDTLIAETETFIELSRERRSALITAAVTGQIDVRGAA